jgi:ribonuclease-3
MTDAPAPSLGVEDALAYLAERLGVALRQPELYATALRHRSAASEQQAVSNERLEYLGDAVVGLAVASHLFRTLPEAQEGVLSRRKGYLVSEAALSQAALRLGLDRCVQLSAVEAASGGRARPSILCDVFEALVGAVYLDWGARVAAAAVRRALAPVIDATDMGLPDFKTRLQERMQASGGNLPQYTTVQVTGPDHQREFSVEVHLHGELAGFGVGKSKKSAEQAAAETALAGLADREKRDDDGRQG